MAASRLSPKFIDCIVESVEQGSSLRRAAHANGFTDDQVEEWHRIARGESTRRDHVAYSSNYKSLVTELTERCTRAMGKRYTVLTNSLYANATTPDKYGRYDTQAADKLLSKAPETRQDWYEQRGVVHEPPQVSRVYQEAEQLTDAELEQALEQAGQAPWALPSPTNPDPPDPRGAGPTDRGG